MKQQLVIALVTAGLTGAAAFMLLRGCESDAPAPITVIRTDTLLLRPDTVYIPKQSVRLVAVGSGSISHAINTGQSGNRTYDSIIAALTDSIAALQARALAGLRPAAGRDASSQPTTEDRSLLAARADTVLRRSAMLRSGSRRHSLAFRDTAFIEYRYPPANDFTLRFGSVDLSLPPDTVRVADTRPWWADLLIGLGSAAAAWLLKDL
ncbi:MAG: hypothetical protein CL946_06640 [Ectothiorhodospiraceae bacterium]|nr:hypothetical protein [Ectothiorhodospiraceae bacterium]